MHSSILAQIFDLRQPIIQKQKNTATFEIQSPKKKVNSNKLSPLFSHPTYPVDINHNNQQISKIKATHHGFISYFFVSIDKTETGMILFFKNLSLPNNSSIKIFNSQRMLIQQITQNSIHHTQEFMSKAIYENQVLIEIYQDTIENVNWNLWRLDTFKSKANKMMQFGFGQSSQCHLNTHCLTDTILENQRKSTLRILMAVEEGTVYCSGTVMNNSEENETPYILSAFHCIDSYTPMYHLWRFDYKYLSSDCETPTNEPVFSYSTGCTFKAGNPDSDFILVQTDYQPPSNIEVYYSGWNANNNTPNRLWMLHHPQGDIMKVSYDSSSITIHPQSINWNNNVTTPPNYHFKGVLDVGSFEIGSSGSSFINPSGQVVGQLHGGNLNCNNSIIYIGRLYQSWTDQEGDSSKMLQPWLDPNNTSTTLDGYLRPASSQATVSGTIQSPTGNPIAQTQVIINDQLLQVTDTLGQFSLSLPTNQAYTIRFAKNINHKNGVTTADIIKIRRDILNLEPFVSPYAEIAADVNLSQASLTSDIVRIRRLIIDLDTIFDAPTPSWTFIPSMYQFPSPQNPWQEEIPNQIFISNLQSNISQIGIIGLKIGDVNFNANPAE